MNKVLPFLALSVFSLNVSAHDVFVKANPGTGIKKQTSYITSQHKVRLYNGRDNAEDFTVHYSLCLPDFGKCTRFDKVYHLAAHSGVPAGKGWSNQQQLMLDFVFNFPGNYATQAITSIEGDGATSTTDNGSISIS